MSGMLGRLAIASLVGFVLCRDTADDGRPLKQGLTRLDDGAATAAVSDDGRFVAFESRAAMVPADVNGLTDIYVLDRACDRITLESRGLNGGAVNGESRHPRLSADGRYPVFDSTATNIDSASTERDMGQVFLSDRLTGTLRLVSRSPTGLPGNHGSGSPDISDDGRIVVFASGATNLVDGVDRNGATPDIYALDTVQQTVARVSVTSDGVQSTEGGSATPRVSGDGRFVAFMSRAPLTAAIDPTPRVRGVERTHHVFAHDLRTHTIRLVSRTSDGRPANGSSWEPTIGADGRFVVYTSRATNVIAHDRNRAADVVLHDMWTSATTLVSRGVAGTPHGSSGHPAISADGRFVAFVTEAGDLLCAGRRCPAERADLNLVQDVYLADMRTGLMQRVSGTSAVEPWWDASVGPALDAAGALIVFSSRHPIDSTDLSYDYDLVVRSIDRNAPAPSVTRSLETCETGAIQ